MRKGRKKDNGRRKKEGTFIHIHAVVRAYVTKKEERKQSKLSSLYREID